MKSANQLSKKIRGIREDLGYSQEYVADQMHISQQMYSKIEKHPEKTTYERLNQLAFIFQINVIALFTGDGSPNIYQMDIDLLEISDTLTIQSIMETHKRNLEKMTKDISILKDKFGTDSALNTETK